MNPKSTRPKISKRAPADRFVIRFPTGMRDLIATVSAQQHRSMHSEIIKRLDDSFELSDALPNPLCSPGDQQLTASELKLISEFRKLDQEMQQALLEFIAPQNPGRAGR